MNTLSVFEVRALKKHIFPKWHTLAILAGVLFYYEILFQWSTLGDVWCLGTLYMLFLCIAYAGMGWLLLSLFKSRRAAKIATGVYLLVSALPFLIEYFVYKQFKLLYDISTVFSGAGDALGSYYREIFVLIFSGGGLLRIFLYLLPGVLYLIFGRAPEQSNWRIRLAALGSSLLMIGGAVLGIWLNPTLKAVCSSQYSFEAAVDNLGFMTGVTLDAGRLVFGVEEGFVSTEIPTLPTEETEATQPSGTTETTEPPIDRSPNVLDLKLDLDADGTIGKLNNYVSALTPSAKNEYTGLFQGKNLIFISAEAFSAEVIDPELTPTLYRLANKGIQFKDFYQISGAGTTGGEYQNIFGMLPSNGGQSFKDTADHLNYYTIGAMLDREGYYGQAFHNNAYTYYDRNKTHINLGYSAGYMGYGNGMEEYVTNAWPQSDLEMLQGTLPLYVDKQPFNVYYMSVSGHSGYTQGGNAMTRKNWEKVQDLPCSDLLKGYFAAQLELENALSYLVSQLELKGIADDTVICISADHFPYGLDSDASLGNMPYLSELYGYDVKNVFQRDHNALILWSGCLEAENPIVVDSPVSSLDILPTLANLFGVEFDSRLLPGRDVFSGAPALVFTGSYYWKTELGTYLAGSGKFVPNVPDDQIPDGYIKTMNAIVGNKISYCKMVLQQDYFRYLFGE